jgi:hypothetical protein
MRDCDYGLYYAQLDCPVLTLGIDWAADAPGPFGSVVGIESQWQLTTPRGYLRSHALFERVV